ncbi:HdeD family acid-resistance protein [Xylanibacter muris]|uniref:DUF308 domain-containing protein n=1 Tax=Xylanibacter muris TaxID=2736290 RepID=A0ABX2AME0_9BACT|nr:DUF308 domain-containing protein [Xylanibacter muris]NPD92359.1 DUF308 domain-containing protein [Xylanibacter muris]
MKFIQSSVFRAICAIITGCLLIKYPDNTVVWITMAIGILFFLSGVISCISYLNSRRDTNDYTITDATGNIISRKPMFPIVGIGCMILGLMLALTPGIFIKALMYIMGAVVIIGALSQFFSLSGARRIARVPWMLWVCPSLLLIVGLYVVIKPMESAALPMIILGWCNLLYGVTEIINYININRITKKLDSGQDPIE